MRHVFIVNPAAGKGKTEVFIRNAAANYFSNHSGEYSIEITKSPKHATAIAREESEKGDVVRLYACGGDGTFSEVVNGAAGFANVQVAPVPTGSGNDFVKTFGGDSLFLNIPALIEGDVRIIDLIDTGDRLAVNVCSAGFDSEVALRIPYFRSIPFVTGKMAYNIAILYCLMKKMSKHFDITIDSMQKQSGMFTIAVAANCKYYGGSYKTAPDALPDDGKLDFVLCDAVHRFTFIKMISLYRTGDHANLPMLHHYKGKKIEISSDKPFAVNLDGEASYFDKISFEVRPAAISIIVPRGFQTITR